ncbi:MAG: DGQHR domain-containing protein [Oscillatoria sp. PMC 1068.18]|nr:DGQHR domain-containing protein [Oscillatoria sp. PMC 1076.18]MEC4989095.1 DGQHR domain-containing protein [Oscillatoria sp. PMC 1068.18]
MDSATSSTGDIASQVLEQENQELSTLAIFLDKYLGKSDRVLAQKTRMGSTEAYIGSVTLEWLDSRVRFASQLPLFRQKFDEKTGNVVRDSDTIDDIQQRPLDWSRQAPLAQYLAARKAHKFPAVLVVISPDWVDNPNAIEWDENKRATKSAVDFNSLDKEGKVGLLDVSPGVSIFALDGQHRLMGIQGLMELIRTGKLQCYNKLKKPSRGVITIDDLLEEYDLEFSYLQSLAYEKIGIEFVPAVVKGETREEAKRRIRSIFVHVNLMAIRLSKGQLALLDEDNGFSIIARKVAVSHPLLRDDSRVNWDSPTVAAKATVLTTLQALQDMSERYLGYKFKHWKSADKKNLIPMRPDDDELEIGIKYFQELFDYLASLPSYQRLAEGEKTPQLRRFSFEKPKGEGNLLFRPVGQVAIAQALGILVFQKNFSLAEIFPKLISFDVDDGFSNMDRPSSLWYSVLYDPNKKRILVSGRDLAARLIVYSLGGIKDKFERAELRRELAEARTIEDRAIGFKGKFVSPKEVGLPRIL